MEFTKKIKENKYNVYDIDNIDSCESDNDINENDLENIELLKIEERLDNSNEIYNVILKYINENSIPFGEYLDRSVIYTFLLNNNI